VIPNLVEVLEWFGVDRSFLTAVLATILTVLVLLAPSVARRFDKRNPQER
jgi:hypothetical protein